MSVILGIDPGSRVTGYGLVRVDRRNPVYLASGCIRLNDDDLSLRLHKLYTSLNELLQQFQPSQAAIEQVFVGKNASSALKLGHARGAAMLAVANAEVPLAEYSARSVKQAVAGSGAADKEQVQHMVVRLLQLDKTPAADAADALAIALCHAFSNNPYAQAL